VSAGIDCNAGAHDLLDGLAQSSSCILCSTGKYGTVLEHPFRCMATKPSRYIPLASLTGGALQRITYHTGHVAARQLERHLDGMFPCELGSYLVHEVVSRVCLD